MRIIQNKIFHQQVWQKHNVLEQAQQRIWKVHETHLNPQNPRSFNCCLPVRVGVVSSQARGKGRQPPTTASPPKRPKSPKAMSSVPSPLNWTALGSKHTPNTIDKYPCEVLETKYYPEHRADAELFRWRNPEKGRLSWDPAAQTSTDIHSDRTISSALPFLNEVRMKQPHRKPRKSGNTKRKILPTIFFCGRMLWKIGKREIIWKKRIQNVRLPRWQEKITPFPIPLTVLGALGRCCRY